MAVVLRCGKQMEKLPHYYFFLDSIFPKKRKMQDASSGDKTCSR